jgi:hypothetical protein
LAQSIETNLFVHARGLIEGWKCCHERRFGAGSWAADGGPHPDCIGLHRLCKALLMSDTCNAARATKRLLVSMAAAAGQVKIGAAAWVALSEGERAAECNAHVGDCAQHLRNIVIKAMTEAATKHLETKLEDDLKEFSSFDRMTVDGVALIRAAFKELHAGGEYAKGKGREYYAWLRVNYPSALHLAFFNTSGTRQDMAIDGAVPLYMNRVYILEFLNSLVNVPGANNQLEKFLWRVLR